MLFFFLSLTFWMAFLFSADEKPYICSLCDFVTTESKTYLAHVRVYHPATPEDRPSPVPSPTSDRSGYAKLKRPLQVSRSAQPSSPDPSLTPVDLCMRGDGCRGASLDRKSLPSHKCSLCSHSTRYPEVLWMHQTVAHRINSSSSNLAPKWAVRSTSKASKENSLVSRRRTGPPPVLEGKECSPLPPVMRAQRTRPPKQPGEVPKKSKPAGHASLPPSSAAPPSFSGFRGSSAASGSQGGRAPARPGRSRGGGMKHTEEAQQSRARSRPDTYPRAGSASSSGSSEKAAVSFSRSSTPSPSSSVAPRASERYLMPQEGLGFMLSSKHGLAEYGRARGPAHPPLPASQGHGRPGGARPGTVGHASAAGRPCGAPPSNHLLLEQRGDLNQEAMETPDVPPDILGFLKSYSPHDLAALYHHWGAANAMLDPTGSPPAFSPDTHTQKYLSRAHARGGGVRRAVTTRLGHTPPRSSRGHRNRGGAE